MKKIIENKEICKKCKGECCEKIPGAAFPEDFPNKESLYKALKSGRWAIDWWEGDARPNKEEKDKTFFIRPATVEKEGVLYDPSWGGTCTFLTATGCELSKERRPAQCRMLVPGEKECIVDDKYNKRSAAIAWIDRENEIVEFDKQKN